MGKKEQAVDHNKNNEIAPDGPEYMKTLKKTMEEAVSQHIHHGRSKKIWKDIMRETYIREGLFSYWRCKFKKSQSTSTMKSTMKCYAAWENA